MMTNIATRNYVWYIHGDLSSRASPINHSLEEADDLNVQFPLQHTSMSTKEFTDFFSVFVIPEYKKYKEYADNVYGRRVM